MATFVLIHGAGDVGWYWHLVEAELPLRGHDTVAQDLPCDDHSAGLLEYVDAVVQAIGSDQPCRGGPIAQWLHRPDCV
jgi:hypothetical protein